jgi:hypothetical protein
VISEPDQPSKNGVGTDSRSTWILPPLIPGAWFEMGHEVEADCIARVERLSTARAGTAPFSKNQVERVRFLELLFFREWLPCEVQVNLYSGRKGLACLLYGPCGIMLLEGKSPPLHAILKDFLCPLESIHTGPAYLRFFCSVVRGDKGRFQIVEPESPLAFKPGISDAEREGFMKMVEPLKWIPRSAFHWPPRHSVFTTAISIVQVRGPFGWQSESAGGRNCKQGCPIAPGGIPRAFSSVARI